MLLFLNSTQALVCLARNLKHHESYIELNMFFLSSSPGSRVQSARWKFNACYADLNEECSTMCTPKIMTLTTCAHAAERRMLPNWLMVIASTHLNDLTRCCVLFFDGPFFRAALKFSRRAVSRRQPMRSRRKTCSADSRRQLGSGRHQLSNARPRKGQTKVPLLGP